MTKILLVDDDPLLIRMYKKKLESGGYTIETAGDGDIALQKAASFRPDLILLDIMMPNMNGYDVLTKLKESPETKPIPVMLLTNVGSSEQDVERGMQLGAVAYIIKAENRPSAVVSKIKKILDGISGQQSGAADTIPA